MNRKNNSMHRETDEVIREALFTLLEQGRTPTVSAVCALADINRATFYRHYQDIPDLMEQTRKGIFRQLKENFRDPDGDYFNRDTLLVFVRNVRENRAFYKTYLNMTDFRQSPGYEHIWEDHFRPMFREHGVTAENHMEYYYRFYMAGFAAVLLRWLESGTETPEELTDILWRYTVRTAEECSGRG